MFLKYLPIFAFSFLLSQDVAGSYQLYGLYIIHQNVARYDATINVSDKHSLGITLPISQINAGEVYKTTYQGPYGHLYAQVLNVILNVNFNEDGSGEITEGSYYPTEELNEDCISAISILPITDNLLYSSNLNAGLTIPSSNILGYIPNENPTDGVAVNGIPIGYDEPLFYGGATAGSASLSQSSVFDYFPSTPVQPTLCDDSGNCFDVKLSDGTIISGGQPLPGYAGGYVMKGNLSSIAPNENDCADLYMEWHAIDGAISQSGLGDVIGEDEDGDGTDFDGLGSKETLTATYLNPSCGYDYPIFGDVSSMLSDVGLDNCFDRLDSAVEGYVMDPSLSAWGNFVTFNYLSNISVDDSGQDYDGSNGRIIFQFDPMCIQNINVRHVMLEFVDVGDGPSCLDDGCMDPEAYNCESSLNGDYVTELGGIPYDNSCVDCSNDGVCDGYYGSATECYYNQAPAASEITFTIDANSIYLDWSQFTPPALSSVVDYRVVRCTGDNCAPPNNVTGTNFTDVFEYDEESDLKYVISVNYENNPYWGWANGEAAYPFGGCGALGDMNDDGGWNVLDIVGLANCVLASNCGNIDNGCAGDMNGDGGWNVLDIVALANCVLADSCGG